MRTFIEPRDSGLTMNTQYSMHSGEEQPHAYTSYPQSYPPYNQSGYAADAEQLGAPSTSQPSAYRTSSIATRAASRRSSMARAPPYMGPASSFAGMPAPPMHPYPSASYRRAPDPRGLGSGAGTQRSGASGRYAGSLSALGPPMVPRTQRLGSVATRAQGVSYPGGPSLVQGPPGLGPKSASVVLTGRAIGAGAAGAVGSGPNSPRDDGAQGSSLPPPALAGGARAVTGRRGPADWVGKGEAVVAGQPQMGTAAGEGASKV